MEPALYSYYLAFGIPVQTYRPSRRWGIPQNRRGLLSGLPSEFRGRYPCSGRSRRRYPGSPWAGRLRGSGGSSSIQSGSAEDIFLGFPSDGAPGDFLRREHRLLAFAAIASIGDCRLTSVPCKTGGMRYTPRLQTFPGFDWCSILSIGSVHRSS